MDEDASALKACLDDELVYVPTARLSPARMERLRQALMRIHPTTSEELDVAPFHIEALLEAEAVAATYRQTLSLRVTGEQEEITHEERWCYDPSKMDEVYQATFRLVGQVLMEKSINGYRGVARAFFQQTCMFTMLLVDIALAYPPPSLRASSGISDADFDPGVKFCRLVRSLLRMNTDDSDAFFLNVLGSLTRWLSGATDIHAAESRLLAGCDLPYPHSWEVYSAWVDELNRMDGAERDVITQFRVTACRARLDHPAYTADKDPSSLLVHNMPLFCISPSGPMAFFYHAPMVVATIPGRSSAEWINNLTVAISDENFFRELWQAMTETGRFVCPRAALQLCRAATSGCQQGLRRPEEFPAVNNGCEVRGWLTSNYFSGFLDVDIPGGEL